MPSGERVGRQRLTAQPPARGAAGGSGSVVPFRLHFEAVSLAEPVICSGRRAKSPLRAGATVHAQLLEAVRGAGRERRNTVPEAQSQVVQAGRQRQQKDRAGTGQAETGWGGCEAEAQGWGPCPCGAPPQVTHGERV